METTDQAFKEWDVAVKALAQGQTILLLRKGGIREQGGQFSVKNKQALLYPTLEHQRPELLKPKYANQVETVAPGHHPETVKIGSWAEITDSFLVAYEPAIQALFPYHIWNETFVLERLKWKQNQPIWILLLRTYRLETGRELAYRSEYGGCRSWIDLAETIELDRSRPALSDADYIQQANKIRNLIANPQSISV